MLELPITYAGISVALDTKPFRGFGTEFTEPILTEVGRVCANFEKVEDEIILLFQILCGGPVAGRSNMSRIIGVTSSFGAKVNLASEAAKTFLEHEPDKRDAVLAWLKLCRRAAEIRNKIAHGRPSQVAYVHEGRSSQAAFLLPSTFDPRKAALLGSVTTDSAYCWNAQQLNEYAVTFLGLAAMIMTVREELAGAAEEPRPDVLDPSTLVRGKSGGPE